MGLKITIMGCGNAAGVPAIGNVWGACDPAEPRNRRSRAALAVQSAATSLVVDTGPDFRDQVNRAGITQIDAVIYTHPHSDHLNGIDELRYIRNRTKKLVPIYVDKPTLEELEQRFSYLFIERHGGIYPRVLDPQLITPAHLGQTLTIGDIGVVPFEQDHGTCTSLGLRFGSLAYSTDMVDLGQQALEVLRGVKTWIVDGGAYNFPENPVHATLRQVYALNEIVQAERVIITHMPGFMDYATLRRELPEGYEPAYDGLEITV